MKRTLGLITALAAATAVQTQAQVTPAATTPPPPPSPWTSSAALGLTLTRGNSSTTLLTGDIKADRKTKADEILLDLTGAYGENKGVRSAESLEGSAQYNLLVTDRFYYGLKADALNDTIADINYRITLSPLVGYYLIKSTNDTLAVEFGPGAVLQNLGGHVKGYATLRFAERYEHKFTATTKLWESLEIIPQIDKFDNYYANFEIGLESQLTAKTALRTYFDDTYYHIPAPGRLKNDAKLVVALAYKF